MSKPYDRLFKTSAEDDPRGLLHLFGSLPLDVTAEIEVIDRELNLPTLSVDHVYHVRTQQKEWLSHYEVQTHYKSDVPDRLIWYAQSLALKFKIQLDTVLILLVERHVRGKVPDRLELDLGSFRPRLKYRVVRLWEIESTAILELGRPTLLPWVTLAHGSEQELRAAAGRIASSGDIKLATDFVVLGGLRYDKDELARMLGKVGTMLTEEMIEESSFYQMVLEKGIEKGIETGRIEEARRSVRRVLALRFPALGNLPELDAIDDPERMEKLLDLIVTAEDPESVRSAIQSRPSSNRR